jgi:hypothetical protein
MGLDQYFNAKRYSSPSEFLGEKRNKDFAKIVEMLGDEAKHIGGFVPHAVVEISVGYLRKANTIHGWIVNNVQGGEDECREHEIDRDQLTELRGLCQKVLDDNSLAEELLPTTAGFFFGSQEYDEFYLQDLQDTIAICDNCLSMGEGWSFHYQSSW